MGLFIKQDIQLHSGVKSDWKLECDALTDEDIYTLAHLIAKRMVFREVVGVPTGGERLAKALERYKIDNRGLPILIVDDVLTSGGSMEEFRKTIPEFTIGVVIFSRGKCPDWISSLFQMW